MHGEMRVCGEVKWVDPVALNLLLSTLKKRPIDRGCGVLVGVLVGVIVGVLVGMLVGMLVGVVVGFVND